MTLLASQWLLEARRNSDLARVTRELYNPGWAAYIRGSPARVLCMRSMLRRVILLSFLPAVLLAQGNSRMTGLTAGINFSTLGGADLDGADLDGRVGLVVGVFGSFLLSETFAFQPELRFIQKGADFTGTGATAAAMRLDYVQIPLMFRVRFSTGEGKAVPFVAAGPAIAFKIGCDAGADVGGGFVSQGCDAIFTNGIAGTDFSGILLLSVRYDYSFTSLHPFTDDDKIYNRGFAIVAAFGFRSW